MTIADMVIPRPMEFSEGRGRGIVCDFEKLNWITGAPELKQAADWINETLEKLDYAPRPFVPCKTCISARHRIVLEAVDRIEKEEYYLSITNEYIYITGGSRAAVYYGVRSLCQILAACSECGGLVRAIPIGCIHDKPRFPYRGLMLDSGRHFQKKEVIFQLLDEMSLYKLNTFHWHISDRQGWRLALDCYPELTKQLPASRAYSNGFYTKEDVLAVRDYAKKLEISIIPELEMPGHSGTIFLTHPELACPVDPDPFANDYWEYCLGNPECKKFLTKILEEIAALFPESPVIHLGGDEAILQNWSRCPVCEKKRKALKLKDLRQLESVFMADMEKVVASMGRRAMTWGKHEGSYELFSKNMILQNWLMEDITPMLETGMCVVNSYNPPTYFDYPASDHGQEVRDWQKKTYEFDAAAGVKKKYLKQVLGGEGCIWTEQLPQWRVPARAVPRIRPLAETLWTDPAKKNFEDFLRRENALCGSGLFRYR